MYKSHVMKLVLPTAIILCSLSITACKKDDGTEPVSKPGPIEQTWTSRVFDNEQMIVPKAMIMQFKGVNKQGGTSHLDVTYDGINHNIEDDIYTLSANNTQVSFVKTGGNFSLLADGGNWAINSLTDTTLDITSTYGLNIAFVK